MEEEYLKLVKFIEYYLQFKPLKMNPQREQEIIKRFLDLFDDDLDYLKVVTDDSGEHPTEI